MAELGEDLPSESHILDIADVLDDISKVLVGDTVVNFETMLIFDTFVSKLIVKRLRGQGITHAPYNRVKLSDPYLMRDGRASYPGVGAKLPSKHLRPKKVQGIPFTGQLLKPNVTLLAESVNLNPETGFNDHSEPQEVSLLLDAEVYSTGRGILGHARKLMTVSEGARQANGKIPRGVITFVDAPGDTADEAAELLLRESESTARLVAIESLRHVFSAGLPGLGKH